jgi:hypothetical protein
MTTDIIHPAEFEVDVLIERLAACDTDDIELIEEIMAGSSPETARAVADRGGPQIRERLYAPTMARMVREGLVEWTGKRDSHSLKVWRVV